MIYKSCSIEEVIARIIRNTRITDPSFIIDMNEWIPEAMGMMKTKYQLQPVAQNVLIEFHKAKLPCNLDSLEAVVYNGYRLQTSNGISRTGVKHVNVPKTKYPDVFVSGTVLQPVPSYNLENSLMWQSVVVSADTLNQCSSIPTGGDWYKIEMGWITTSMRDAVISLYFWQVPLDANGLPLIPDNEDYKQALYYYVRAMMIGAGYPDKMMSYDNLMQKFELHAARAIGQIKYPTVDQREAEIKSLSYNISENYWDRMFDTTPDNADQTLLTVSKGSAVRYNPNGNLIEDAW
jgi:hypothetical protein